MIPTAEQLHALELFRSGQSLAIEAGAGTGKTSTLKILAESTNRRGQYVAFNRAIVQEAGRKMPGNVSCSTAHGLAYRAVGKDFEHRLHQSRRMRSIDLANALRVDAIRVRNYLGEERTLTQTFLAGLAMNAITRFCQTADPEPTYRHVPLVTGLDEPPNPLRPASYAVNREVGRTLEPILRRAWADLSRFEGTLPFKHEHYLKLWQLGSPRIGADFILFDEAQDANPVMVAIVAAQEHAQIVWVGDSQQEIYAWAGAVNALSTVPADSRAFLTQSFRFGPAVADVANSVLERIPSAELRLSGYDEIASVVAPVPDPDVVLTRTNAVAVRTVLEAQQEGKRVHLVGGGSDIVAFAKAARLLMDGEKTDHPELACFDSWGEVQAYVDEDEQGGDLRLLVKLVDEFGVPTILEALDRNVREQDADLVVSTAHKAKGREWDSVKLGGDFPDGEERQASDEELRLLYVAVTRAKRELDITAATLISRGYVPTTVQVPVTSGNEKVERRAPAPAPAADNRPATAPRRNEHVGTVGERIDLDLVVVRGSSEPGRFGGYFTVLRDADGRQVKWFADDPYTEGARISGSWKVKEHGEYRDQRETVLYYAEGVENVASEETA